MSLRRCLFAICPLACALAQVASRVEIRPETVVMRVGDAEITAAQFDAIVDSLPPQLASAAKGSGKKQFADQLATVLILSQEGYRRKLDETPAFQVQSKYRSDELMANFARHALSESTKIGEATARAYYDAHKAEYERARARHILVRTPASPVPAKAGAKELSEAEAEAKAKSLLQRIKAGADFAMLASTESDDTGSAQNGGDLGWFDRGDMVPAFEEAVLRLKPGETSGIVRSPFGYHIIKLEDHELESFDQVQSAIEERLRSETVKKRLEALQNGVKVDYNSAFFESGKR